MLNRNYFIKSHALGNIYIILDKENITFTLNERAIERICNVNFGVGADGILLKIDASNADVGLGIYNKDGQEAEKSGNGLAIFCKYLYDYGIIKRAEFTVETKGGIVKAKIGEVKDGRANTIAIDMGRAIFKSKLIPTRFEKEIVEDEAIKIDDREYIINCVSLGNPHCVILKDNLDIDEIKRYGGKISNYSLFPNRINVQFAKAINRKEVEILIWERGVGHTLASGTSACAVASVLRKKGLIDEEVIIKMEGGRLKIEIDNNMDIRMTGKARQICEGILSNELLEDILIFTSN